MRIDADWEAPPRFVKLGAPDVHMYHTGSAWLIVRGADPQQSELLAEAASTALHPSTVGTSAWKVKMQGLLHPCSEFELICDGPNTEQVGPSDQSGMRHAAFLRVSRRGPAAGLAPRACCGLRWHGHCRRDPYCGGTQSP
jgi:hypothetical protein